VQEAICRGIPAIVSAEAGVAERYGPELAPLLLGSPESIADLTEALWQWRSNIPEWETRFQKFGESLRGYGWMDMARRIVSIANEPPDALPALEFQRGNPQREGGPWQ